MATSYEFETRISYADTDRMGVVYYGNYFELFERGRTEWMRSLGMAYKDLEEKRKLFLPVMEASCRYLAPARYDDLISIKTRMVELGVASIAFTYEISLVETKKPVATGFTKHPFVDSSWKPARIPDDLRKMFEPCLSPPK